MTGFDTSRPRTTRGTLAMTVSLLLALLLVGCPSPDQEALPGPSPDPGTGEPADPAPDPNGIALDERCTNPEYGFQVDYPEGWVVNQANGLPPCSAFDPDDTGMPAAGEIPVDIAIVIRRDQVTFERAVDFDADFTVEVVSREEMTVDGRRAVVAELEHTGQGLYAAGQRQYAYYVDISPNTLIAVTHDLDAADPPPYQERRQTLAAMMASLRFLGSPI